MPEMNMSTGEPVVTEHTTETTVESTPEAAQATETKPTVDLEAALAEQDNNFAALSTKFDALLSALQPKEPKDEDGQPDYEAMAREAEAERDAARAQAAQSARETAVLRASAEFGVLSERLLDSVSFLKSIEDADNKTIREAVKKAAEKDQSLVVKPVRPAASGTDTTGKPSHVTKEAFDAMKPTEKAALLQSDPATYRALARG